MIDTFTKKCNCCKVIKTIENFLSFIDKNGVSQTKNRCEKCRENDRIYYKNNKEKIINRVSIFYYENKNKILEYHKIYYEKNKDLILKNQKEYVEENKVSLNEYRRQWKKNKRKTDPIYKLRNIVSNSIFKMLKLNSGGKYKQSILDYLKYTIDDLKISLENQFEPWMNWDNYGKFNKRSWKDEDKTTWKWNIDHIVPQSSLPFSSMEEENFQKCWELYNLRPYSAKKNNIDGRYRTEDQIKYIKEKKDGTNKWEQ